MGMFISRLNPPWFSQPVGKPDGFGSDLKRHFEDHLEHETMYFTASIAQTYGEFESLLVWEKKLSPVDAVAETDSDLTFRVMGRLRDMTGLRTEVDPLSSQISLEGC